MGRVMAKIKTGMSGRPSVAAHRRMKRGDRRQQLIEVAVKFFSEFGFQGASTKSIAEAAGITEAVIYRHFATKKDLYSAILDNKLKQTGTPEWMGELRRLASANKDQMLFRSVAGRILDSYRQDPDFHRLMFRASIEGHEVSALLNAKIGLPFYEFLRDYVARRQAEGAFLKCDPGIAVFALIGLPTYFAIVTRLFGIRIVKASQGDVLDTATRLFLNGIVVGTSGKPTAKTKVPSRSTREKH
jgi:TetR/AcrR family transcriptional regulator